MLNQARQVLSAVELAASQASCGAEESAAPHARSRRRMVRQWKRDREIVLDGFARGPTSITPEYTKLAHQRAPRACRRHCVACDEFALGTTALVRANRP